jgi:hypothetical protein
VNDCEGICDADAVCEMYLMETDSETETTTETTTEKTTEII